MPPPVLVALGLCHLLNDTIQSLLPALYPVFRKNSALSFPQIGFLHFAFQVTASILQPAVGLVTDRRLCPAAGAGQGRDDLGAVLRLRLRGRRHRRGAARRARRRTCIGFVYRVCAFLPAIGPLTVQLPEDRTPMGRS